MGTSSSCQLFESCSTAFQWILTDKFRIHGISHLLDDFFFIEKTGTNKCLTALKTFLVLAHNLSIPIKSEKTVYPTTYLTIYGIEIDSKAMVARLPKDKIKEIQNKKESNFKGTTVY